VNVAIIEVLFILSFPILIGLVFGQFPFIFIETLDRFVQWWR
jgi:hypothetical protein